MGRAVSQVLDAREDVVVAARFDWGETADLSLCDVIIDFSTPAASVALAQSAAERGGPALVIGSTGFTDEQEADLMKAAEKVAIVKSGNFSLGVNILIGRPGLGHRDHRGPPPPQGRFTLGHGPDAGRSRRRGPVRGSG